MRFAPTRRSIVLALSTLVLALGVIAFESFMPEQSWPTLVWLSAVIALVLALATDTLLLPSASSFRVTRKIPGEVGVGQSFDVSVAFVSSRVARVRYQERCGRQLKGLEEPVVLDLKTGKRERVTKSCVALERGVHRIADGELDVIGPLGLMRRRIVIRNRAQVAAIPGIEVLRSTKLVLKAMQDADVGASRARGVGRGGEFESLAPYVPGDPPGSVDWKGYARTRQLVVRRYEPERRRHIMLCCDAGRLMGGRAKGMPKVDQALSALARLAAAALSRGDLVGLMIFDGEVRTVLPPRAGPGQLAKIVRASLGIAPSPGETAYTPAFVALNHTLKRRALVVVVTDFDNEAQGFELRRNIEAVVRRHVIMVCGVRDSVYGDTIREEVNSLDQAYRQLAALTLLEERHSIYQSLERGGVHIIDAEPEELAVPMLNTYGSIVSSGRL